MTPQMPKPAVGDGGPGLETDVDAVSYPQYSINPGATQPPAPRQVPMCQPPSTTADAMLALRDELVTLGLITEPYSPEFMEALARAYMQTQDQARTMPTILEVQGKPREVPPGLPLSDTGNAERLVTRHGHDLRFCHPWGLWLVWDGRRWRKDDAGSVERRTIETVRNVYQEAANESDKDLRAALASHALKSESDHRRRAMIRTAQAYLPILPSELDADPWLLNVENGTLDLRTGHLHPHRREDFITKLAPVVYDSNAHLELWECFLATATGGDAELAAFLQRAAGYTLTGNTGEEILLFVHGPTNTGKSTFLEALKAALGDYATTADFETFLKRNFTGGPRPDIARLAGARLVVSLEVDEGRKLAEGLVKMLTGGDTVAARELYSRAFEFRPAFKLWLAANHAPEINSEDGAMWRRILRVPFEAVIPEGERDPQVKATLSDPEVAGPAVLAWAVRGCLNWQIDGLGVCPTVKLATQALREEMDPLKDFLDLCCVFTPTAWTPTADLRAEYDTWCREVGERAVSGREFTKSLRARGCSPRTDRIGDMQRRGWLGVGLLTSDDDEPVTLLRHVTPVSERSLLREKQADFTENAVTKCNSVTTDTPPSAPCPACGGSSWECDPKWGWCCENCGRAAALPGQPELSGPAQRAAAGQGPQVAEVAR